MNKRIFSILVIATMALSMGACSSGTYDANPASNANGSINPLNPLNAKQFTWAGSGAKVSLDINGSPWSTDTAWVTYVDSLHTNVIAAYGGGKYLTMYIQYGWANNLYNMGFKQYSNLTQWADDSLSLFGSPYQSALGNSGELYMTQNDTLNFCGKFYCQIVDGKGRLENITNGVFTLTKY